MDELDLLIYALDTAIPAGEISPDTIIYEGEFQCQLQELFAKYNYYAANEFFAVLTGDDLKFAQAYLKEHFSAYSIGGVEWQHNADDAFRMQEEVWAEIEDLVG